MSASPNAEATFPSRYCPREAMRLQRLGLHDPTMRFEDDGVWKASRTPQGPATLRLDWDGRRVDARAWGPGASWIIERTPGICGLQDAPELLEPRHPFIAAIVRDHPHVALGRSPRLFDTLVSYVLQQRVTFGEAFASWRSIVEHWAEPAPGPAGLLLPASPEQWRGLGPSRLAAFGVDEQRARILREVVVQHRKIDRLDDATLDEARSLLPKLRGIGPWTAAMATAVGRGDPDAVPRGDFAIASVVTRAFTGRPRGTDEMMLDLLEPYRGQRFRIVRLLYAAGLRRQRFAARRPTNRSRRIPNLGRS